VSKIAVVIPIHNGLEDTKLCLKSIYAALRFSGLQNNVFLIVVDDGSSDGSTAFIENKYPA
jgi:glycosyltransferase involved in cell wall biosynthesis